MNSIGYGIDIIVLVLLYVLYIRKKQGNQSVDSLLLYLSFCFVFLITLSPFITNIPHLFSGHYTKYNFDPFVDLLNGYGSPLQECIANIVLFIPFTFFIRKRYHLSLCKAVLIGAMFSFCIEIIQPLISDIRVCDITDMITNTIGSFVGAISYSVYNKLH